MKRTPLKRGRRRTLTAEERQQAYDFHEAFWSQACAVCGYVWPEPDVHHVVEKQELKSRGLPLYDKRNGLPLCRLDEPVCGNQCHEKHTNAAKRVPFRKLRAANIDYAYEVLGPFAADYIRARYPMDETKEQS